MAYSGSTHGDIMTISHDKYAVYNEQLYKKVLPTFKRHIPVDIMDEHVISDKLMISEMEKIRKKEENDGHQAGAGLLLQTLHTKPNWFSCVIEAMKSDACKLHEFIPKFEGIKEEVNKEWLKKHPRSELPRPVNASPHIVPESSFDLPLQNARIQKDSDANTKLKTPIRTDQARDPPMAEDESSDCDYVDGASDARSLQTDATPEIQQESREPPLSHFTRRDHPGLKDALSFKPAKDFDRNFVRAQLAGFPAFTDDEEEQQIIQLLQPHLHKAGSYVIWYWALAKRPTVCVVADGERFVTFVVHKSSKTPTSYFIQKRQKRSQSLKEIVQYHIDRGISYTRDERTVNILLTTPVSSRSRRL
ncbi:uncharacterized protein LOC112572294 isoform X2 [Pomacea canaliculata]|uniref:uncharacterized protein LOC112572294 isoform X2 n=1 Tax=Pomacea canaliculata TaxID=400727 RepID=UPI000D73FDDA|nr:uncharacterized protein LOC112572294 isoform X2 [Pomacea canaliculata]